MAQVLEAEGHVDVLVNNAGVGMNAVVEEVDIDEAKSGLRRQLLRRRPLHAGGAARRCATRRSGTIVNISSVAGRVAALAQAVYASSKWAVECLSENLAQELAPWDIRVRHHRARRDPHRAARQAHRPPRRLRLRRRLPADVRLLPGGHRGRRPARRRGRGHRRRPSTTTPIGSGTSARSAARSWSRAAPRLSDAGWIDLGRAPVRRRVLRPLPTPRSVSTSRPVGGGS